ncbi:MAG TPA: transglutaminase-like domain-containing protein, partial [Planctomycetota bacterium]|nr:transglutaminase-like domain-containing protein [Planctomycetota bacterium]
KVVETRNERIVRTSIPFEYEPFSHPRLKELRERYAIDEVVKGAKGDLEILSRLAAWSAGRWSEGHLKEAYPPWDAIEILKPHRDGTPVGGFCQQYNLVFLQACESLGFAGRAVSIGPGDSVDSIRSGHEVVEIWSNDHRGWIYMDGQAAWYAVDAGTGRPLPLLDLRRRQIWALRREPYPPIRIVKVAPTRHDWKGLTDWPAFVELRLIPRSNFLEKPSPLPLNQGMRGWFWTGHHIWTDEAAPASPIYGHRVARRGDLEWTLNQAHLILEATPTPGEIRVHLDTGTPGFEAFLAGIDGGSRGPVRSGFLWKLHRGENRLEVRPRNSAGREGIAGAIVLGDPGSD